MKKGNAAIADTEVAKDTDTAEQQEKKLKKSRRTKRQPPYNVILWDDDHHSYDYVIRMMKDLFGHPFERGYQLAVEVDTAGKTICLTTTREHAELKRDQIHAFGRDSRIAKCVGSMSATIEPVE